MQFATEPTKGFRYKDYVIPVVIAVLMIISAFLHGQNFLCDKCVSGSLGDDSYKSLLQFSSATLVGGLVFLYLNIRRDEASRFELAAKERDRERAARATARHEFLRQVDQLYRAGKQAKRNLRAHVNNIDKAACHSEKSYFEKIMATINEIQIEMEQTRELVRIKIDIFTDEERNRLVKALRYSSRYYHDVFQDYEKARTELIDSRYRITDECESINDFISGSTIPPGLFDEFERMKDSENNLIDRWKAFEEILSLRRTDPKMRRYRYVAEATFALCADTVRSQSL